MSELNQSRDMLLIRLESADTARVDRASDLIKGCGTDNTLVVLWSQYGLTEFEPQE